MKLLKIVLVVMIILTVALAPLAAGASDKKKSVSPARKIWDTIWRFINFLILAVVLVTVLRKPLLAFLKNHGEEIEQSLGQSKKALEEAEAEHHQAERRLAEIERLVDDIKEYMRQDAERTQQRIMEGARETSDQIIANARELADSMLKNAREEVKIELIQLALEEAEKLLRRKIAPEDQHRLIGEYIGRLSQQNPA